MRNCEKMTELISESMERPLTLLEKLEKSWHTMMCDGCKNFESNTIKLKDIIDRHKNHTESSQESDDSK